MKIWEIKESRVPYVAVGIIFTFMFGFFSLIFFRANDFTILGFLMLFIALASIGMCGYRRSILLDSSQHEVRIRHAIFSLMKEKVISTDELEAVTIQRKVSTQHSSVYYYVILTGKNRKIKLWRKDDLEKALRSQNDVSKFLDLHATHNVNS